MRKILILLTIITIFLASFSSAELIFQQDTPIDISHAIRIDGASSDTINANITVKDPLNKIIAIGSMSYSSSTQLHNISLNSGNTSKIGTYNYCISAVNNTLANTQCFEYVVTPTGEKATISQGIIFSFLGILSLVFFGLALFGAIKIPWKHPRNDSGIIVGINDLKYVKLLLWFVTYLILIFITFAFRHVSLLASWDVAGNFLNAIFWFLISFLFPVFVIVFVSGIISYLDTRKIDKMIRRGMKLR